MYEKHKYLTQETLFEIFKDMFPNHEVLFNKQLFVKDSKGIRPDIQIPELNLVIEFDGYQHYTKASIAINDLKKTDIYSKYNLVQITIPYFVQLDQIAFDFFIKSKLETIGIQVEYKPEYNKYNYPHGFIDEKAVLPADFCSLGILRFCTELEIFPCEIVDQIKQSLLDKVPDDKIYGLQYVFPLEVEACSILAYPEAVLKRYK